MREGSDYGKHNLNQLDIKLAKRFTIDKVRLRVDFDLYNVFNSSWPYTRDDYLLERGDAALAAPDQRAAAPLLQARRATSRSRFRFRSEIAELQKSEVGSTVKSGKSRAIILGFPLFACTVFSPRAAAAQHAPHVDSLDSPGAARASGARCAPASARRMTMRGRRSPEAQRFYDQGLAYLHNYVWIEAARSFHQALRARSEPRARARRTELRLHRAEQAGPGEAGDRDRAGAGARKPATTIKRHVEARALQMAAEEAPRRSVEARGVSQGARRARSRRFPTTSSSLLQRGIAESPDPADRGQGSVAASIPYLRARAQSACAREPHCRPRITSWRTRTRTAAA